MSGNSDISGDVSSTVNNSIIPDDMSDPSSSLDSPGFEDSDLLSSSNVADVTAQLAAAGQCLLLFTLFPLLLE